jgi:hypothetical protein
MRESLQLALGAEVRPAPELLQVADGSYLTRPSEEDRIPAAYFSGTGTPALIVHPNGMKSAQQTDEFTRLRDSGRPVLLIDAFQTGRARERREKNGRWFLCYNKSEDAERVQDLLTALQFLRSTHKTAPELIASGDAMIWGLFAAAVDPNPVQFDASVVSATGSDAELKDHFFVPGIQHAGGVAAARAIVSAARAN